TASMAVSATQNLETLCCGQSSSALQPARQPSSTDCTAMPTRPSKPAPSSRIRAAKAAGAAGGGAGTERAAGGRCAGWAMAGTEKAAAPGARQSRIVADLKPTDVMMSEPPNSRLQGLIMAQ